MLRDEKQEKRLISFLPRSASPLRSSTSTFSRSPKVLLSMSIIEIVLIVMALLLTEGAFAASGNATTGGFSEQQITSFVKTVTTELELSKNWKTSFANTAGSNLYCNSIVLGQGVRAGNPGLYTWFTCSAIHRLNTSETSNVSLACTGFSSPVWIQPTAGSIKFQAVPNGPEYLAFRTSAPAQVQSLLDSTYNQMNAANPKVLIARATQGASTQKIVSQNNCQ